MHLIAVGPPPTLILTLGVVLGFIMGAAAMAATRDDDRFKRGRKDWSQRIQNPRPDVHDDEEDEDEES